MEKHVFWGYSLQSRYSGWDVSNVSDLSNMFRASDALIKILEDGIQLMSLIWIICFIGPMRLIRTCQLEYFNVNSMRGMFTSTNCSPNIGGWNVECCQYD